MSDYKGMNIFLRIENPEQLSNYIIVSDCTEIIQPERCINEARSLKDSGKLYLQFITFSKLIRIQSYFRPDP